MADLNQGEIDVVNRLAEPASKEADILGCSEGRKEAGALKIGEKEVEKEEEKLPKLSAADFRTYNSMAEHMEYFVSTLRLFLQFGYLKESWKGVKADKSSTTTSANPGPFYTLPARSIGVQLTYL
jgi:hypothetical protein